MASTITSGTLTVKITEEIILNGRDQGSINEVTISDVGKVAKGVWKVLSATNGTQIYGGAATEASLGTHKSTDIKYIRVTNLDDTNFVILHLEGNAHYSQHKLEAGKSFMLGTTVGFDNNADVDSYSAETITNITALAVGADVDIEIFVASA